MSEWFSRFGFAEVADGLLSGAYPLDTQDIQRLADERVEIAYNLCEQDEYAPGQRDAVEDALAQAGIEERRLPMTDYGRLSPESLDRAVTEVLAELRRGRRVYLHCRAGWQRSAAVAAAVIARREGLGLDRALDVLRRRKPHSEPLPHQRADLVAWWVTSGGCADG
ncbi:MAG: dual specificity protein phosphatase family protein [Solirubrobacteraceae bacterium]